MIHPVRREIPIYLAAIGPKNTALAAEIADGWLPVFFSPGRIGMFREWLAEGLARAGPEKDFARFDIAPTVIVQPGDDVAGSLIRTKQILAFYLGGMGARGRNFYCNLAGRYGYEEQATEVQEHFLAGRRPEAVAAVPDALADEVSLCGPRSRIAERLAQWRESGVGTLLCSTADIQTLRLMAELVL